MKKILITLGLLAILAPLWSNGAKDAPKSTKPVIAVSIVPQGYFVKRIGGDLAESLVLVGPGQSPHAYEPKPSQLVALSKAAAWITSGTDFEIGFRPKAEAQFPDLKIVDGTEGMKFRTLDEGEQELGGHDHEAESNDGEAHGDHDDHDAEGHDHDDVAGATIDRHTWLGRESALIMAGKVRDALIAADPANSATYKTNHDAFVSEIEATFAELRTKLAHLKGRSVLVYHPAFGYFLDEFGMRQISIETGGKEPGPKTLAEMIQKARDEKVPAIFVQAQFPVTAANTVAKEVGAAVVALDPLADDWLGNLTLMGDALAKAHE